MKLVVELYLENHEYLTKWKNNEQGKTRKDKKKTTTLDMKN